VEGYTKISSRQLIGLQEAGASASEILAYSVLTRKHEQKGLDEGLCWASVDLICSHTGLSQKTATRALTSLCHKCFTEDGVPIPVLVRVAKGHKGMVTRYTDNLWIESTHRRYPSE